MDLQNVDVLERGGKRKASGYDYMRSRQESAEAELDIEKRERNALSNLLEKEQRSVKRLTEQLKDAEGVVEGHARNVKRLTDELMNRDSRVMNLEAENYIMSAELHDLQGKVSVQAKYISFLCFGISLPSINRFSSLFFYLICLDFYFLHYSFIFYLL